MMRQIFNLNLKCSVFGWISKSVNCNSAAKKNTLFNNKDVAVG